MTFDPYKLIKYHLYLLQLENYELGRFWKLLLGRGWFPQKQQRKDLVWTAKAKILFILSELLIIFFGVLYYQKHIGNPFTFIWQRLLGFLVIVYLLDFLTPVFLSLATIILWPVDWVVKKILVMRAKFKIENLKLKVIAVAGSYGKTTMKEVLGQVLGARGKLLVTPESVNTPVGIARWILKKVDPSTQIIIIEMGEHYRGDVKEICKITKPDITVITGINEAHMERMKTLDNVTATIFEAVSSAKAGAQIFLNGDDKNVMAHYKEYVWPDQKIEEFRMQNAEYRVFNPIKLTWECEVAGIGKFEVNLLGEYALGDVDAAIKIAKGLGMSAEQIKAGIAKIKPVEHRLQPIRSAGDILVIDDSYNGNPDGVTEAIKVLARFTNRRKLYITPGLVEMGKSSEQVHRKIGEQLVGVTDVIILIKNSVTPWIEQGVIAKRGVSGDEAILSREKIASDAFAMTEVLWFNTAQEAHASLSKILKPGDVILFQNDWGDNYV